jgi:hypothetical protein
VGAQKVTPEPPPFACYELWCEAKVAGGSVTVRQVVDAQMYDSDPDMREAAHQALREALVRAILDHWKPVIKIRR